MKNILTTYEKALGQAINLQKSKLVFSRNVSQQLHEDILEIMNVNVGLGFGKYMRLSTSMGKSQKATFNYVKEQIQRKLNLWKGNTLFIIGKEILIQYNAQAIPNYSMNIYLFPRPYVRKSRKCGTHIGGVLARGSQRVLNDYCGISSLSQRNQMGQDSGTSMALTL